MRIAAAALSAVMLLSSSAEARPRHHHRHHRVAHVRPPPAPVVREESRWWPSAPSQAHSRDDRYLAATWGEASPIWSSSRGSEIFAAARRYLGHGKVTPYAGPWCRDFTNKVLLEAGVQLRDHGRDAIGALRLGHRVTVPEIGDIVVMPSHVTFFAGKSETGRILGLGGNQGPGPRPRGVTISEYSPDRVIAYIRPQ